ncbi:probable G-protein coupled receptor Mth-like 14 isoform X5 [Musca domestica]|uniref:Probable G-protein coupled receptor Mth-like 14 isoform X5 n=1 Tax=Musca domestica TaxID=7370 RepID=A0A1I8MUW4_MUSDO|nr:probable G-protein coupled receptor Mth-like 14 isoform X5 [Musca domestica]
MAMKFLHVSTIFALIYLCYGYVIDEKSLFSENIESENEYVVTTLPSFVHDGHFPHNCSQRERRKAQPIYSRHSRLKKCCPLGESLSLTEEEDNRALCVSTNRNIQYRVLNVTLYDSCIEDMETDLNLPVEIGNPCNTLHISLNKGKTYNVRLLYMTIYCVFSFTGSLILVILTKQKGLPGMPSYFIQGYTESIRESQRYFIPPVSTLLLFSFFVMAATFFGFQKFKSRGISLATSPISDVASPKDLKIYEEVKKDAKCISLLGLILICTWLLEIVTFYSPGPQIYLILMDMINGLQGVFVLLIFLVIRRRRTIIFQWWNDRGSYVVEKVELDILN